MIALDQGRAKKKLCEFVQGPKLVCFYVNKGCFMKKTKQFKYRIFSLISREVLDKIWTLFFNYTYITLKILTKLCASLLPVKLKQNLMFSKSLILFIFWMKKFTSTYTRVFAVIKIVSSRARLKAFPGHIWLAGRRLCMAALD
jgi:hypothetical protein